MLGAKILRSGSIQSENCCNFIATNKLNPFDTSKIIFKDAWNNNTLSINILHKYLPVGTFAFIFNCGGEKLIF